jgi:hypothetical protein
MKLLDVVRHPVCAWCHKAEKVNGVWVSNPSPYEDSKTSHGICPLCSNVQIEAFERLQASKVAA